MIFLPVLDTIFLEIIAFFKFLFRSCCILISIQGPVHRASFAIDRFLFLTALLFVMGKSINYKLGILDGYQI